MNIAAFKSGLIWANIGEIAVVSGIFAASVSKSVLLRLGTARQSVHLSRFRQQGAGF